MIFPRRFHFLESPSSQAPAAGHKHTDVVVTAVFSHRRWRFLLQIGDDNAERWLGSLNYMRQSKFARFATAYHTYRSAETLHSLRFLRRRSLLYFSRSPASHD